MKIAVCVKHVPEGHGRLDPGEDTEGDTETGSLATADRESLESEEEEEEGLLPPALPEVPAYKK